MSGDSKAMVKQSTAKKENTEKKEKKKRKPRDPTKPRKANAWLEFVKDYRSKNPDENYRSCLKSCKAIYKKEVNV